MQQALDALKNGKRVRSGEGGTKYQPDLEDDAIASLEAELAKPEPVVSFTDNDEGLCIQLACNGSYHWQNLSENEAAEFFVNAYRGRK